MNTKDLAIIILPLLTGFLGSYLTYYFTNRSIRNETILKFKEEKYANLLILLQGFVGATASGETKRKFFEEQYRSWLYCSDEVVQAINRMVRLVIDSRDAEPAVEDGRQVVGDIVVAMRKALLGKTQLTWRDFRYTDVNEDTSRKSTFRKPT